MKSIIILFTICILASTSHAQIWQTINNNTGIAARDIYFSTPQEGWVSGSSYPFNNALLHTQDGGVTWNLEYTNTNANFTAGEYVYGVFFLSPNQGWVAGDCYDILHTTDGGATWTIQSPGVTGVIYTAIHFNPNGHGWISGTNGVIIHTTDYGAHWTVQNSGTNTLLNRIYFYNDFVGIAVGVGGVIIRTTDGGANWTPISSPTTYALVDISHIDPQFTWVAGYHGTVLFSDDWGLTWTNQNTNISDILVCVDFVDEEYGWAAGYNGTIINTTDGGLTWSSEHFSNVDFFNGLDMISPFHGFAASHNGRLLEMTRGSTEPRIANSNDDKTVAGNADIGSPSVSNANKNPMDKINNDLLFQIYPNPVDDFLQIVLNQNNASLLLIYSVEGKLLQQQQITDNSYKLDVSNLNAGVYIVEIATDNQVSRQKFVKR